MRSITSKASAPEYVELARIDASYGIGARGTHQHILETITIDVARTRKSHAQVVPGVIAQLHGGRGVPEAALVAEEDVELPSLDLAVRGVAGGTYCHIVEAVAVDVAKEGDGVAQQGLVALALHHKFGRSVDALFLTQEELHFARLQVGSRILLGGGNYKVGEPVVVHIACQTDGQAEVRLTHRARDDLVVLDRGDVRPTEEYVDAALSAGGEGRTHCEVEPSVSVDVARAGHGVSEPVTWGLTLPDPDGMVVQPIGSTKVKAYQTRGVIPAVGAHDDVTVTVPVYVPHRIYVAA